MHPSALPRSTALALWRRTRRGRHPAPALSAGLALFCLLLLALWAPVAAASTARTGVDPGCAAAQATTDARAATMDAFAHGRPGPGEGGDRPSDPPCPWGSAEAAGGDEPPTDGPVPPHSPARLRAHVCTSIQATLQACHGLPLRGRLLPHAHAPPAA